MLFVSVLLGPGCQSGFGDAVVIAEEPTSHSNPRAKPRKLVILTRKCDFSFCSA